MEHSQPKENSMADFSFQHEPPCRVTKVQLTGHMRLLRAAQEHLLLLHMVLGENPQ